MILHNSIKEGDIVKATFNSETQKIELHCESSLTTSE